MNKTKLFIPIILLVMLTGFSFASRFPDLKEGTFELKPRVLTYFDLVVEDLEVLEWNPGELFDAKPADFNLEIPIPKLSEVQFVSFKFGNNEKKIWAVLVKDPQEENWGELYVDQDCDFRITSKEKIKSLRDSGEDKFRGISRKSALTLVPVPLKVSYKGQFREFEKTLNIFIGINIFVKSGLSTFFVGAINGTFFEGSLKTVSGKTEKFIKCRIFDIDGNGCYNDYGKDLLFMDLNNDEYYKKSESQKLVEFFVTGNGNLRKQFHTVLLPYPGKMAVWEAGCELTQLELEPLNEESARAGGSEKI